MKKISRREFLSKGLKSAVAFVAVTACGGIVGSRIFAAGELKTIEVGDTKLIIATEKLKEAGAVRFIYNGKKSIILYNNGNIKAFENICTHKGGPTDLKNDKLVCEWHKAEFDPVTGKHLKGPGAEDSSLPVIELRTEGDNIFIV